MNIEDIDMETLKSVGAERLRRLRKGEAEHECLHCGWYGFDLDVLNNCPNCSSHRVRENKQS